MRHCFLRSCPSFPFLSATRPFCHDQLTAIIIYEKTKGGWPLFILDAQRLAGLFPFGESLLDAFSSVSDAQPTHRGTKSGRFQTLNHTFFHEFRSELASGRTKERSKAREQSKHGVASEVSEWFEQMRERTSEWLGDYVSILVGFSGP